MAGDGALLRSGASSVDSALLGLGPPSTARALLELGAPSKAWALLGPGAFGLVMVAVMTWDIGMAISWARATL